MREDTTQIDAGRILWGGVERERELPTNRPFWIYSPRACEGGGLNLLLWSLEGGREWNKGPRSHQRIRNSL